MQLDVSARHPQPSLQRANPPLAAGKVRTPSCRKVSVRSPDSEGRSGPISPFRTKRSTRCILSRAAYCPAAWSGLRSGRKFFAHQLLKHPVACGFAASHEGPLRPTFPNWSIRASCRNAGGQIPRCEVLHRTQSRPTNHKSLARKNWSKRCANKYSP